MRPALNSHRFVGSISALFFLTLVGMYALYSHSTVQAAGAWYVAPTGNDSNDCHSPTTPCRTIRTAIAKASSNDTVDIAAGLYTENLTLTKPLSLHGVGAATTIIDGGGAGQVINIGFNLAADISGVTIQNGKAPEGGGIYLSSYGRLNLTDCVVANNVANSWGGGISNYYSGTVIIANCIIRNNSIINPNSGYGGGIYNGYYGKMILMRSKVTDNNNLSGRGGGIVSDNLSTLYITDTAVTGNRAVDAGGIEIQSGTASIYSSTFSNNTVRAIYSDGNTTIDHSVFSGNDNFVIANSGAMTITNSRVVDNMGLGIFSGGLSGGRLVIENSYVANNKDGGIWNESEMTIRNSEVSGNTSGCNGGVDNRGIATIINTTIAANVVTSDFCAGGGIQNSGSLFLIKNAIINNRSLTIGGGILAGSGDVTIIGNLISGNSTDSDAGGNHTGGGIVVGSGVKLTVLQSTLSGNTSSETKAANEQSAGALFDGGTDTSIHQSCITGNSDISVVGPYGPTLHAEGNYWGSSNGPAVWEVKFVDGQYQWVISGGSGDSVNKDGVDYDQWLSQPPFDCSNPQSASPPLPLPNGVDVSVGHIEVNQALLAESDPATFEKIPLIAEKQTLVRVFVDVHGSQPVPYVTARLFVQDEQGSIHGVYRTYGSSLITAPAVPDPGRLEDTINFLPDKAWLKGSVKIWAEVDPYNILSESNETNNTSSQTTEVFNVVTALRIGYVALPYHGILPNLSRIRTAERYLKAVYPLSEVKYFPLAIQVPYTLTQNEQVIGYLNEIWTLQSTATSPLAADRPDQIFGWIAATAVLSTGVSDPSFPPFHGAARVAFGKDILSNNTYQVIMAHELGHNLGRKHPFQEKEFPTPNDLCDRYDEGWPYDTNNDEIYDYRIHAKGLDFGIYSNTVVSETTDDLMIGSHCRADPFGPKWVSPYTFTKLHQALSGLSRASTQVAPLMSAITVGQSILLVSGLVYPNGTAELGAAYQITSSQVVTEQVGTQYCLNLDDSTGSILTDSCFDLSFVDPEWGITKTAASFVRILPYSPNAARLVLRQGSHELAARNVSSRSPTVILQRPNGGEVISGTVNISWTSADADGDSLDYIVAYSSDGGQSWHHLAIDATDTHLEVNAATLPGSNQALVRVTASDGINTASDISDNAFTVLRHRPDAIILGPLDGATLAPNWPFLLQGKGYDLEDGVLDGSVLRWSSNRDGDLGTGQEVWVNLSRGRHAVTLTAMDSDGNTSTSNISISVGSQVYLPSILRER